MIYLGDLISHLATPKCNPTSKTWSASPSGERQRGGRHAKNNPTLSLSPSIRYKRSRPNCFRTGFLVSVMLVQETTSAPSPCSSIQGRCQILNPSGWEGRGYKGKVNIILPFWDDHQVYLLIHNQVRDEGGLNIKISGVNNQVNVRSHYFCFFPEGTRRWLLLFPWVQLSEWENTDTNYFSSSIKHLKLPQSPET